MINRLVCISAAKYCVLHYFVNCSIFLVSDGELFAQKKISGAPIISLGRLNPKSSNVVHRKAISILATGRHITHKRGVVMVT